MRIDILTLFPEICEGPLSVSMIKRALDAGVAEVICHNLRDWATGKHRITDDAPYGGGQGMVMKPEPIFAAVEELRTTHCKVLLMSPRGQQFSQSLAQDLSSESHLILICGHYEGVDERVVEHLVDGQLSIGDYVLTNGALAAAIVADAVIRLLPGALGHENSALEDSFSDGLLEFPHYTRPAEFRGWKVPDILRSGDHAAVEAWRKECALAITRRSRPDLLDL